MSYAAGNQRPGFFKHVFGFQGKVTPIDYATVGFGLTFLKYLVEAAVIFAVTDQYYMPWDYLNPLLSSRERFTADAPVWFGMAWVCWTLPFLWVAISMSVRRAANIGLTPWLGLIVLIPYINILAMLVLACLPENMFRPLSADEQRLKELEDVALQQVFAPAKEIAGEIPQGLAPVRSIHPVIAALLGLAAGIGFLIFMVVLSVTVLGSYGSVMFIGTPIVTGAVAAYVLNYRCNAGFWFTVLHGILTISVACVGFLAFGIEGAICIVMAIPILGTFALMGTVVGYLIAASVRPSVTDERRGLIGCVLAVPLLASLESQVATTPTFEVLTAIEINAPREVVWQNVIEFPDIEAPPPWYFRMGIAMPQRAWIEGTGVGAVRHCEFTTGSFVEPITTWEAPSRLAFDVTDQPEPMYELTPYRHIHPPHLDTGFRSVHGEFRLIELSDGRTRLEGRTWYQLRIFPLSYWTIWSDGLIHSIHRRVLDQIKLTSERESHENSPAAL